ncbi:MAG TPA: hypothetical protein DIC42_01670 [Holosporales bacterium]|nr:hypothetical protein [Holosporales bacterium]
MSTDNITPIRTGITQAATKPVTLEMVIASMDDWRLTKHKLNEKIPEKIWDQVFALVTSPEPLVLKALGISQGQFISKKLGRKAPLISTLNISEAIAVSPINQVSPSNSVPSSPETALKDEVFSKPTIVKNAVSKEVEFCEVKAAPAYPLAGNPAKAFSTETCVVELYRPDGMLMKIHMCTDRFDELLTAFANGNGSVKC